jgi:hypothetical protein
MLIIGTHEKLHAQAIRKINHLLHLAKIATPTPQELHPLGQTRILHFCRPNALIRARQTHCEYKKRETLRQWQFEMLCGEG